VLVFGVFKLHSFHHPCSRSLLFLFSLAAATNNDPKTAGEKGHKAADGSANCEADNSKQQQPSADNLNTPFAKMTLKAVAAKIDLPAPICKFADEKGQLHATIDLLMCSGACGKDLITDILPGGNNCHVKIAAPETFLHPGRIEIEMNSRNDCTTNQVIITKPAAMKKAAEKFHKEQEEISGRCHMTMEFQLPFPCKPEFCLLPHIAMHQHDCNTECKLHNNCKVLHLDFAALETPETRNTRVKSSNKVFTSPLDHAIDSNPCCGGGGPTSAAKKKRKGQLKTKGDAVEDVDDGNDLFSSQIARSSVVLLLFPCFCTLGDLTFDMTHVTQSSNNNSKLVSCGNVWLLCCVAGDLAMAAPMLDSRIFFVGTLLHSAVSQQRPHLCRPTAQEVLTQISNGDKLVLCAAVH